MQLHHLKSSSSRRGQRVGRGGKRGTTSGRGQKGQKSRSGRRIRPAERDLIIRLPKKRGFHNKPKSPAALVIPLASLKKIEGVVDMESLKKAGLLPRRHSGPVKILLSGEVPKNLSIKGIPASRAVRRKVEEAKGKIE